MKISTEVLTVLSQLQVTGDRAVITQQLDRKLYTKVKEVLEACGAKWNRKAQAHLFDGDAGARIDLAIVTGDVLIPKNDLSFFPTPTSLAAHLVKQLNVVPSDVALEPSAGTGRIVDALLATGACVFAVERDAKMRAALPTGRDTNRLEVLPHEDFLDVHHYDTLGGTVDVVAMNPPFAKVGTGDHLDHVRRAHSLLVKNGRLGAILPTSIEFRQDKRHAGFRDWYTTLGGTVVPLPPDSFKESGTGVNVCMLLMGVK